jgi:hypothetical protein
MKIDEATVHEEKKFEFIGHIQNGIKAEKI